MCGRKLSKYYAEREPPVQAGECAEIFQKIMEWNDLAVCDVEGWTLLLRAEDAASYSTLAARAAGGLINMAVNAERYSSLRKTLCALTPSGAQPSSRSPLMMACETSFRDLSNHYVARMLLAQRADVNEPLGAGTVKGIKTPLLLAAGCGLGEVIKVLMEFNCDKNAKDEAGRGAWELACGTSRNNVATTLLDKYNCPRTAVTPPPKCNRTKHVNESKSIRRNLTVRPRRALSRRGQQSMQKSCDGARHLEQSFR